MKYNNEILSQNKKENGYVTDREVALNTLTEGQSVLLTEMNFSWDHFQVTGALEGSDCRIICTGSFKALASNKP